MSGLAAALATAAHRLANPHGVADPLQPTYCRVRARRDDLADTFTIDVEPPGGRLAFQPGQFTMLALPGQGEVPISISGDPAEPERLVHTIRAVGAVTRALAALRPGSFVGVRGPYGTSWPVAAARGRDVVVVAGGLGLAPLRPAILHLLRCRADYGHVAVLAGARTPQDLLYAAELKAWAARGDVEVEVSVDAAPPGWTGRTGFVTARIPSVRLRPEQTAAFLCGPEVMMRFAARALAARGVPEDAIAVSLERNMQCAVGVCGHCQLGPLLLCRDGPVVPWSVAAPLVAVPEL